MNLYIQVAEGQPVNHPALAENLVDAFGSIPPDWEPFVRVPKPNPTAYQILVSDTPTYEKVDDVWTDVWDLREMTPEEKLAKQEEVKLAWAQRDQAENWSAWVFDEERCKYQPPVPRPQPNGKLWAWCGADYAWKEMPPAPEDGILYKFDFLSWAWVESQSN
jgi:hypothetical protein